MGPVRQLPDCEKAEITRSLRELLASREEVRFACLHGSFLGSFVEPQGFRDIDLAVWVDPDRVPRDRVLEYECELSAGLERSIRLPIDAKVLNYAPLSFQYAVTHGEPILVRDEDAWFAFRERTWRAYLDFAPLAREVLVDLLAPVPPRGASGYARSRRERQ